MSFNSQVQFHSKARWATLGKLPLQEAMMVVTVWRQIFTCAGRHSFFSCTLSVLVLWIQDVESLSQVRVVTWRDTVGTESNIQSCWWKEKDQRIVDPCKKYSLRNVQDFKPRLYCCNASNYDEHNKDCLKNYYPNAAGTQKSWPKLSGVGPNFPMDMIWKHLIPLRLSKKQPSLVKIAGSQGCWAGYCWLSGCTVVPAAFCQ